MSKKTADGRKLKDYPCEILVRLNEEQLAHMRHHFGWMGADDYVAYFLIISEITKRPNAGPLTEKVKVAVKKYEQKQARRGAKKAQRR